MDSNRLRAAPGAAAWLRDVVSACVVASVSPWRVVVVMAQKSPWPPWCCVLMLGGVVPGERVYTVTAGEERAATCTGGAR
jgi:hypothetical protein